MAFAAIDVWKGAVVKGEDLREGMIVEVLSVGLLGEVTETMDYYGGKAAYVLVDPPPGNCPRAYCCGSMTTWYQADKLRPATWRQRLLRRPPRTPHPEPEW